MRRMFAVVVAVAAGHGRQCQSKTARKPKAAMTVASHVPWAKSALLLTLDVASLLLLGKAKYDT